MKRDMSNEEIIKQITKYEKRCSRSAKAMYSTIAIFGVALISLAAGLIGGVQLLTTISAISAGVSVVGQLGFFGLSFVNSSKSIDLQDELKKRESISKNEELTKNINFEKVNNVDTNKSKLTKKTTVDKLEDESGMDIEM